MYMRDPTSMYAHVRIFFAESCARSAKSWQPPPSARWPSLAEDINPAAAAHGRELTMTAHLHNTVHSAIAVFMILQYHNS